MPPGAVLFHSSWKIQQGTALAASLLYREPSLPPKGRTFFVPFHFFRKPLPQLLRLHSLLPQLPQAQRIMPFRQADILFVAQQRAMKICWHWISQRADQQQLPCGALEQVCAADDFSDLHGCIVDHHGKLIGGDIVATPEQKVGEVASGDELLVSEIAVVKGDRFAVGDFEAPAHACG